MEPRKILLAFYFVQDTKLSSGSAAGCLELMNVPQGAWVCREPGAALQASLLRWRQAAVSSGQGCWAEQAAQPRAWLPSKPRAIFQMSLLLPSEQLNRRC